MIKKSPAIIIASYARSGTSYLASLIRENYQGSLREPLTQWTTQDIYDLNTGSYGVWGVKCFSNRISMMEDIWPPEYVPFQASSFIYLTREDIVAQAVSLVKAGLSQYWKKTLTETVPSSIYQSNRYNKTAIAKCVRDAQENNQLWETYFHDNTISPYRITYERLFEDHDTEYENLCWFLRLPYRTTYKVPNLLKQADRHSQEWIARYKAKTHSTSRGPYV